MGKITGEKTVQAIGKKPHDLGVRQGTDLTMGLVRKGEGPIELLVGIINTVGEETAIAMDKDSVLRVIERLTEYTEKME